MCCSDLDHVTFADLWRSSGWECQGMTWAVDYVWQGKYCDLWANFRLIWGVPNLDWYWAEYGPPWLTSRYVRRDTYCCDNIIRPCRAATAARWPSKVRPPSRPQLPRPSTAGRPSQPLRRTVALSKVWNFTGTPPNTIPLHRYKNIVCTILLKNNNFSR